MAELTTTEEREVCGFEWGDNETHYGLPHTCAEEVDHEDLHMCVDCGVTFIQRRATPLIP